MVKCVICGKEIEESKYGNKAICSAECLSIDFWNGVLDDKRIFRYRFFGSDEIRITNRKRY